MCWRCLVSQIYVCFQVCLWIVHSCLNISVYDIWITCLFIHYYGFGASAGRASGQKDTRENGLRAGARADGRAGGRAEGWGALCQELLENALQLHERASQYPPICPNRHRRQHFGGQASHMIRLRLSLSESSTSLPSNSHWAFSTSTFRFRLWSCPRLFPNFWSAEVAAVR